jgi:hypothetical protein
LARRLEKEIGPVGPGSYNSRSFIGKEGHQISMGAKTNSYINKDSRNLPGPATYDSCEKAKSVLKSMPSYKIGNATRENSIARERNINPDSATYNPSDTFTRTNITSIGFGKG